MATAVSSFVWAFLCWMVLTWSVEPEQLISGALLAAAVAGGSHGIGSVVPPWALLRPRRVIALAHLTRAVAVRMATAGVALSRCIWSETRPRSGMVAVANQQLTDGGLAGLGLLTSLTPDNQLVDIDRDRTLLLYYTLRVRRDAATQREVTTGTVERAVARV